jgi:hypothetical protein
MRVMALCALLMGCGGDGVPSGGAADLSTGGGSYKWYLTCGDPVCRGHTPTGVTACTTQVAGQSCATLGDQCDPSNMCNALLQCSATDPRMNPGGCPISRRQYKADIEYLNHAQLARYADELLKLPLATYRYKEGPPARHLGFILEDAGPSAAADGERDMVDLYGYTSMAVAALKVQAQQIDELRTEVSALKKELGRRRR